MQQTNISLKSILFVCLLGASSMNLALAATPNTPDEEQPVNISANSLNAQEKSGISIYKGNVIVTQGSLTLKGDVITVKHPNSQLQTVKSTGKPASFKRFSQTDQAWLKGQANTIEYNAINKTVLLVGNAQVEQPGQHLIKGPKLFYDMTNQTLKAQGTEQEKGRVSVTFNPATTAKPAPQPNLEPNSTTNPAADKKSTPLPAEQ